MCILSCGTFLRCHRPFSLPAQELAQPTTFSLALDVKIRETVFQTCMSHVLVELESQLLCCIQVSVHAQKMQYELFQCETFPQDAV